MTSTSVDTVSGYLDAVNHLCDDLLPKVIAVTGGGSLDVPVAQYLKQQPAHRALLVAFDGDLAKISVPPAAAAKAAAMRAYIRYADRLDTRRLQAARRGASAYAAEIAAEKGAPDDPSVVALNAAGFNGSCQAR